MSTHRIYVNKIDEKGKRKLDILIKIRTQNNEMNKRKSNFRYI